MIYKNLYISDTINSLGFKNIDFYKNSKYSEIINNWYSHDIYIKPYIYIKDISDKDYIEIFIISHTKNSKDIIFVLDYLLDRKNLYAKYTSIIKNESDLYKEFEKYFSHDMRKIKIEKMLKE